MTDWGSGSSFTIDSVRIMANAGEISTAPVSEPATMLLLGSGLIGLAGLGRKHRN